MIYVLRHGQTDLNKEGRLQGRQGFPLNDLGIKQAESIRDEVRNIRFDYVLSSPQERAIQTAEIVTGMRARIDPRIDVFDLGEADNLRRDEVKLNGLIPDSEVYRDVEDLKSFVKRVFSFMEELKNEFDTKDVNVLLSGHRCTTGCIGAYFMGIPENGDLLKLSLNNGDYKVYHFNQMVR